MKKRALPTSIVGTMASALLPVPVMRTLVALALAWCAGCARAAQPPAGRASSRLPVTVRRVTPDEMSALYPNDWHDDPALRSRLLSDVAALVASGLFGESNNPRAEVALQKRVYTEYLHRFAVSPATERALVVAFDAEREAPVGSVVVEVCAASADARRENEPLVERDPSRRPAWPRPWDRRDPLAVARALLGADADSGAASSGGPGSGDFAPRALVDSLVVAEDWRRVGVGAALLEEAERLARDWGQPELRLRVEASNSGALAFYGALGYACPTGMAEVVGGRKLVADGWGCKWAPASDTVLQKALDGASGEAVVAH